MGCSSSKAVAELNSTHLLTITTGDKKGAAVDAKVYVTFCDGKGDHQELTITQKRRHHFKKGDTDDFYVELNLENKITEITIRRDDTAPKNEWFIEKAEVQCRKYVEDSDEVDYENSGSVFPINRWVKANSKLKIVEYDSMLPQDDPFKEQRELELGNKRDTYILSEKIMGAPPQVDILPEDEKFSFGYLADLGKEFIIDTLATDTVDAFHAEFASLDDFKTVYNKHTLPVPTGMDSWDKDEEFGHQKLAGCNPTILELCKSIPAHLAITKQELETHLEKKSLEDALDEKKLYIIDLRYLADIECVHNRKMPGPTCLLYVNDVGELVPIAIQLMPEPAEDNPVFQPTDPKYTWLAAKMWFNLADCSHHQSLTHLGFTHLLMDSVVVCTNRRLSLSHPIHKLLAPHFIYLLAINSLAISSLLEPDGWVDKAMHIGRTGMFNILEKKWAEWSLKENGNLLNDLKRRGVDDTSALPNYHYRDDAILLWNAITEYVTPIVDHVYDTPEKLAGDDEIQTWLQELITEAKFKGLPEKFTSNEDVIEVVTVFIFTSSVQHAAVNFGQYNQYAFPPNYPSDMHIPRPTNKEALSEDYVVKALPPLEQALNVMMITDVLSRKATNSLGNFEVQYAYDPTSLQALHKFQKTLTDTEDIIKQRNENRKRAYIVLLPSHIPNAISI